MAYGARNQILDASEARGRDTNSIMQGWVDRGPYFYWDMLTAAAGATLANSYQMFSVGVGGMNPLTGSQKTELETNMVRGNQFPPPRCLLLMSLGFYVSTTMAKPDIDAILDGSIVRFRIDDKVFHEGQLFMYPSGAGLNGVTTKTGESAYAIGLQSPTFTRRYGEWSKYIAPLQQFSLNILFPNQPVMSTTNDGGTGLKLWAFLDGLTDRSVQ